MVQLLTDAGGKGGVTRADIEKLLPHFYASVRRNERLGPIFHKYIGENDADWAPHFARIGDFWVNVMLQERAYQGNPMQVHLCIPEIRSEDFEIWLGLFDKAASEVLSQEKAAAFSLFAHRIGRSLAMGIAQARSDGPPSLRV